jgi:hypothetical protein
MSEDSEDVLEVLEFLVKNGTERRGEAVVLMYDDEDGFFLSSVDTGCWHHPVKDVDLSAKRKTLKEAILAAKEWDRFEKTRDKFRGPFFI